MDFNAPLAARLAVLALIASSVITGCALYSNLIMRWPGALRTPNRALLGGTAVLVCLALFKLEQAVDALLWPHPLFSHLPGLLGTAITGVAERWHRAALPHSAYNANRDFIWLLWLSVHAYAGLAAALWLRHRVQQAGLAPRSRKPPP